MNYIKSVRYFVFLIIEWNDAILYNFNVNHNLDHYGHQDDPQMSLDMTQS